LCLLGVVERKRAVVECFQLLVSLRDIRIRSIGFGAGSTFTVAPFAITTFAVATFTTSL
jgi:hypothetical protein